MWRARWAPTSCASPRAAIQTARARPGRAAYSPPATQPGKPIRKRLARRRASWEFPSPATNAPRSPTNKILSKTLKRKKRTARRTLPGGLEKSIAYEADGRTCSVFVAANSFADKYAHRIHDEKGVTWRNRGPGTVAKGTRADEKFIARAVRDNVGKFRAILADELNKALPN